MKKYIMDIYGLLETKLLPSRVATLHKFRLRDWKYLSNTDVSSTARIVVFWDPCTISGDLFASSAQALHLSVHNSSGSDSTGMGNLGMYLLNLPLPRAVGVI